MHIASNKVKLASSVTETDEANLDGVSTTTGAESVYILLVDKPL
jgi:hypothetical protein